MFGICSSFKSYYQFCKIYIDVFGNGMVLVANENIDSHNCTTSTEYCNLFDWELKQLLSLSIYNLSVVM
jgi:hypothetical protein